MPKGTNQYTGKIRTHCKNGHEFTLENTYTRPDGFKVCKTCRREQQLKFAAEHKDENREQSRVYSKRNPEKRRFSWRQYLRKRAGFSQELFHVRLEEQRGKCDICKEIFTEENVPHADHKHVEPPMPRGLLCNTCNSAIGLLKDRPQNCEEAAVYLRKYGEI